MTAAKTHETKDGRALLETRVVDELLTLQFETRDRKFYGRVGVTVVVNAGHIVMTNIVREQTMK